MRRSNDVSIERSKIQDRARHRRGIGRKETKPSKVRRRRHMPEEENWGSTNWDFNHRGDEWDVKNARDRELKNTEAGAGRPREGGKEMSQ